MSNKKIKENEVLNVKENVKRLDALEEYKGKLCDVMDGTSKDHMKHIKEFYRIVEVLEYEFRDCNDLTNEANFTENGLGRFKALIDIIDILVDNN